MLLNIAGKLKDVADEVRNVAGEAAVGTIELAIGGTGSILDAGLGDGTSEALAKIIEKTKGDAFEALLDHFAPDESLQEAVKWVMHLLGEKLEGHKMTYKFFFRRKKPLAIIMMMIFKAHHLEHQSLAMEYKPLKFKAEEFDELKRLSRFCIHVYSAVKTEDERKEENDSRSVKEIMEMLDEDDVLLVCDRDLHLEGKKRCPRFMVFTDTRSHSIVVAIRGTNTT